MHNVAKYQTYAMHMGAEHRRITRMVGEVRQILGKQVSGQSQFGQLAERLKALRHVLAEHFAEEEEGGCLEEAVTRCPSLSRAAAEVRTEQASLLDRLDRVIGQTAADGPPAARLCKEFVEFIEQLESHEAAENRILQQAFGTAMDFDEGWD